MSELVTMRRAVLGYGATPILHDVDLALRRGSFVGVLGPNGAGKTTLLRGLLGLLPPLAGDVSRADVAFGYVPQRETLDPVFPLTVEEVVCMGAFGRLTRLGRVAPRDREQALEELARVRLAERRKQRFDQLSGGQRQRALIARALVMRPALLVLDEPTSGVDRPTQELVLELITDLNRERELAIVIVSHQLAMTRTVREVLWVEGGRVGSGLPEELAGEVS